MHSCFPRALRTRVAERAPEQSSQGRWRLGAHRKQPRAEISKYRTRGAAKNNTMARTKQASRRVRGTGMRVVRPEGEQPQSHGPRRSQPAPRLAGQSREALQHPLALFARPNVGAADGPPRALRQQQPVALPTR